MVESAFGQFSGGAEDDFNASVCIWDFVSWKMARSRGENRESRAGRSRGDGGGLDGCGRGVRLPFSPLRCMLRNESAKSPMLGGGNVARCFKFTVPTVDFVSKLMIRDHVARCTWRIKTRSRIPFVF